MQHAVPVDTPVGTLSGRGAIRLSDSHLPAEYGDTLTLVGEFDGRLCSRNPTGTDWNYTISFPAVQGVRIAAVDVYDLPDHMASFEKVMESEWLADMGHFDTTDNIVSDFAHYRFWTNDDVFEVVSNGDYTLELTVSPFVRAMRGCQHDAPI